MDSKHSSPLLNLPPELQLSIYLELPDFWTVVALRLACRQLNDTYAVHQDVITRFYRQRLVRPIEKWYTYMTTLHLDPDLLEKGQRWNIEREKSGFALDVMRYLPYFKDVPGHKSTVCANACVHDWRLRDDSPKVRRLCQHYDRAQVSAVEECIASRTNLWHMVPLTSNPTFILDTVHAKVSCPEVGILPWSVGDDASWQVDDFADWMCDHVKDLGYVYLPTCGGQTRVSSYKGEVRSSLDKLLADVGWPDAFEKDRLSDLVDWFQNWGPRRLNAPTDDFRASQLVFYLKSRAADARSARCAVSEL